MTSNATITFATCPKSRHEAVLYASDELPSGDRATYERHLAYCAECRGVVEAQHAVSRGYRAVSSSGLADATLESLSLAAQRSAEARKAATGPLRLFDRIRLRHTGRNPAPILGWALAASILLAVAVFPLGSWTVDETLSPSAIAWDYDIELETPVSGSATGAGDALPTFSWIDDQDDSFSNDVMALADDIDTFTTQVYEF